VRRLTISKTGDNRVVVQEIMAYGIQRRNSMSSYFSATDGIEKEKETPIGPQATRDNFTRKWSLDSLINGDSLRSSKISISENGDGFCEMENNRNAAFQRNESAETEIVVKQPRSVSRTDTETQSYRASVVFEDQPEITLRQKVQEKQEEEQKSAWRWFLCWCPFMCPSGCDLYLPLASCCPEKKEEPAIEMWPSKV